MFNVSPVLRFMLHNKNSPLAQNQKKSFTSSFSGRSLGFVGLVCPLAHWAYLPKHTHTHTVAAPSGRSLKCKHSSNNRSFVEHFWAECDEQWQEEGETRGQRSTVYHTFRGPPRILQRNPNQWLYHRHHRVCVGDSRGFRGVHLVPYVQRFSSVLWRFSVILGFERWRPWTRCKFSGILADYKFPTRIKKPPSFAPPTVSSPDGSEAFSLSFAALSASPVIRCTPVPGGGFTLKQIIEVQHWSKSDPVTNGIDHVIRRTTGDRPPLSNACRCGLKVSWSQARLIHLIWFHFLSWPQR